MSDIKLFRLENGEATELAGTSATLEKSLQKLIENNLEALIGIRFLASEHSTGKKHGGRIDTLGLDENGCPVIIEYKRSVNENVINQGLFYLDWLLDHKAEFQWLVMEKLGKNKQGKNAAENVEWSRPRLICIAGDFTKYDEHAVQQMNRNIELIRYRHFGDGLLLLELVNAASAPEPGNGGGGDEKTISEVIAGLQGELLDLFDSVDQFLVSLGDDVQKNVLKYYVAYKRLKNFACLEVHPQKNVVRVYVKVDPSTLQIEKGFTRDVRQVGHFGTGDLEISIHSPADLERAQPYIVQSYEAN